jgi:hypothetical protein
MATYARKLQASDLSTIADNTTYGGVVYGVSILPPAHKSDVWKLATSDMSYVSGYNGYGDNVFGLALSSEVIGGSIMTLNPFLGSVQG